MDLIVKMNWVDVLVLIIVLRVTLVAFKEGLSHEIFPLFGSVISALLALYFYDKLAYIIYGNIKIPLAALDFLCFLAIMLILVVVLKFVRALLNAIIKVTWHPVIEKFGGIVIGLIRAVIVASTVLVMIALMPFSYLQWSIREKSLTGMYLIRIVPSIYENLISLTPLAQKAEAPGSENGIVGKLVSDKSIGLTKPVVSYKDKPRAWEKNL